jgi:pyruvate,water dikinase
MANTGKVQGKVRLIKLNTWRKDIVDLEKGEILVAISTKPDYIIAMERAAAFVTDEGGITCHAAIVAREMNKPCIVGTKIATKVLKDGDLVEVDAEKGIVRKI